MDILLMASAKMQFKILDVVFSVLGRTEILWQTWVSVVGTEGMMVTGNNLETWSGPTYLLHAKDSLTLLHSY
jgi:hypothetical protein